MNTAHRFQHKYTGVQILIWHKDSKELADYELWNVVQKISDWIYLDQVIINTVE